MLDFVGYTTGIAPAEAEAGFVGALDFAGYPVGVGEEAVTGGGGMFPAETRISRPVPPRVIAPPPRYATGLVIEDGDTALARAEAWVGAALEARLAGDTLLATAGTIVNGRVWVLEAPDRLSASAGVTAHARMTATEGDDRLKAIAVLVKNG